MVPAAAWGGCGTRSRDRAPMMSSCGSDVSPVGRIPALQLGHRARVAGSRRPRQGDDRAVARHRRFRRVARAADRRNRPARTARRSIPVDGEAGSARPRSTATIASSSIWRSTTSPIPQDEAPRRAGAGRPSGGAHRAEPAIISARNSSAWEIATAVAGAVIGINPFDQPGCRSQQGQDARADRRLRDDRPSAGRDAGVSRRAVEALCRCAQRLGARRPARYGTSKAGSGASAAPRRRRLCRLPRLHPARRRRRARCRTSGWRCATGCRAATCLGFGPRFLHSTGQAYKGGPDTGVFLQITSDDAAGSGGTGHQRQLRRRSRPRRRAAISTFWSSAAGARAARPSRPDLAAGLGGARSCGRARAGLNGASPCRSA